MEECLVVIQRWRDRRAAFLCFGTFPAKLLHSCISLATIAVFCSSCVILPCPCAASSGLVNNLCLCFCFCLILFFLLSVFLVLFLFGLLLWSFIANTCACYNDRYTLSVAIQSPNLYILKLAQNFFYEDKCY